MTQLETKIRIKIRTAERDIAAACLKLRDVLIDGANTSVIRAELSDLHRRVESGNAELADIAAAEAQDQSARIAELAKSIAADSVGRIEATLARFKPPAKPKTVNEEITL